MIKEDQYDYMNDKDLSDDQKAKMKKIMEEIDQAGSAGDSIRMRTGALASALAVVTTAATKLPYEMKQDVVRTAQDMLTWGVRAETLGLIQSGEIKIGDIDSLGEYANDQSNKLREILLNMITNVYDEIKNLKEAENETIN